MLFRLFLSAVRNINHKQIAADGRGRGSMRLFHISDLHIGLKLFNRDLSEDQAYILDRIAGEAAKAQPDAILIAGDIYDRAVPSAEAVELFDAFTTKLREAAPEAEIMMISGNHDSAPRVNVFRHVLKAQHIRMIGLPPEKTEDHIEKVTLTDEYGPVHFYLLPFVKPSMVKAILGTDENGLNLSYDETLRQLLGRETIDTRERNVLVSHQFYLPVGKNAESVERMSSEIRTVGNIDEVRADVLEPFDYAALGHIHKPMKVGSEFYRYCVTPIPCSVDEAGQQKGIIQVDMGAKGDIRTKVLPLTPLRNVIVVRGTLEEVLEQSCGDYTTVILTDKADLHVTDMQDRLRAAFPYLLEIRRENVAKASYSTAIKPESVPNPIDLCLAFLKDAGIDEKKEALLREVIDAAEEVQK